MELALFHGSPQIVEEPIIIRNPNRKGDYGFGFYCTTSLTQAKQWAKQHAMPEKPGYVNVFTIQKEALQNLKILHFHIADEQWVDFVYKNRNVKNFYHSYDIVIGPVADDRVNLSFSLYEQRIITKKELIARLETYKLKDQILFHTEEALKLLNFKETIKLDPPAKKKSKGLNR